MTVKNITYTKPVTGTSSSNPTYISGADGGSSSSSSGGSPDYSLTVADMTSRQLLEGILIELKILNLRQQEVFEETVKEEDVSG